MNAGKTKEMISSVDSSLESRCGVWICIVSRSFVGSNLILHIMWGNWRHIQCSDVIGSLSNVMNLPTVCTVGTKQWAKNIDNGRGTS